MTTRHELEVEQAALAVLAVHPPVSFAAGSDGSTITAGQLNELVKRAIEDTEQEAEVQRETAAEERLRVG